MNTQKNNQLQIRNSTAEFLIFTNNSAGETIEVRLQNNTNLNKAATCAFFAQVQMGGSRQITRNDVELKINEHLNILENA